MVRSTDLLAKKNNKNFDFEEKFLFVVLLTCLHKIITKIMVTFIIKAIIDKIVSGTVKLNDNISILVWSMNSMLLINRNLSGHENVVRYPCISANKMEKNYNCFGFFSFLHFNVLQNITIEWTWNEKKQKKKDFFFKIFQAIHFDYE